MAVVPSNLAIHQRNLELAVNEYEKIQLTELVNLEIEKRVRWKKDNERRRANYIGLIYAVLSGMAKKGMLDHV